MILGLSMLESKTASPVNKNAFPSPSHYSRGPTDTSQNPISSSSRAVQFHLARVNHQLPHIKLYQIGKCTVCHAPSRSSFSYKHSNSNSGEL